MFRRKERVWLGVVACLVTACLSGCQPSPPGEDVNAVSEERQVIDHLAVARAAVASEARPEADVADDAKRRPAEVMAFFQIEPGMKVLDVLCGAGYYAEILSGIVGENGRVYCHNNQSYLNFMGEAYEERYADGRLPNVERLDVEVADLDLESGSLQAVTFVLGFHDLYFRPADGGWPEMDPPALLAELYDALVPGGVLGIVDHAAAPGGETIEIATQLHRIDESVLRSDLEAAGFVLEAGSEILRNPEDAFDVSVFDASVRRMTDRFVLRYRRPADA